MTEAEQNSVSDALATYYPNTAWSPYQECDQIMSKAWDRLYANTWRWTNAPADYWGDSHSYYQKVHLTNRAFNNGPLELAKTMFHEAAHLYFGASVGHPTIEFFTDECMG